MVCVGKSFSTTLHYTQVEKEEKKEKSLDLKELFEI